MLGVDSRASDNNQILFCFPGENQSSKIGRRTTRRI